MVRSIAHGAMIALSLSACRPDAPLFGSSSEPIVILVLTSGPSRVSGGPPDSTMHALVATVGSPNSGSFRSIQRFEMRRRSDSLPFDWRISNQEGPIDFAEAYLTPRNEWNAHLPWTGTAGRLGRSDLAPNQTYDLLIETNGRLVVGAARIPSAPNVSVTRDSAGLLVTWPDVGGAALFAVDSDTEFSIFPVRVSPFRLPMNANSATWPSPAWVRVSAIDSSLVAYSTNGEVLSSGLVGAYGVFGAFSIDSALLPPPLGGSRASHFEESPFGVTGPPGIRIARVRR